MIVGPPPYHVAVARKPELRTVIEAAAEVGRGEATIWRWLAAGHLTRYKSRPGGPRKTLVDVNEVREVMDHPPADPVPRD